MGKSREFGWDLSRLYRFELMHDCGHLIYGQRPPAEPKPVKVSITVDEAGVTMVHTMGSDTEVFELLNHLVETWKRQHN